MELQKFKRLKEATSPIFSMLRNSMKMNTFCLTKFHGEQEVVILDVMNVNDILVEEGLRISLEDAY
ncbi:hypothetical protein [Litchfieldia alkalitelluris]|uniref:hypothetical protein n=1 Tax=Litchfieldia alkalitelluris TaxID=304268 RepID=UPI000996FE52|nr:hypothetical protein [Litchfieldia alkalitelluris]